MRWTARSVTSGCSTTGSATSTASSWRCTGGKAAFGGPAVEAEDYKEIVIALDGQKITARTFSMGNGLIFINNNPMAFAVGSKVEAKLGKRNELEVRVEGRRNPVKFAIQRVEIIQE